MPRFSSSTYSRHAGRWLLITAILELGLTGFFVYLALTVPEAARGGMLLTAGILGLTGIGLLVFGLRARAKAKESDRLQAVGLAGTATIMGITQTGTYLNEQPQLELDLSISVPGRQPYQASHRAFVPLILLARVQPGGALPVKVDPQDPSNFVIDWQGGSAMPGMGAVPGMGAMPGAAWPGAAAQAQGSSWPMQAGIQVPGQAQPTGWPQAAASSGWPQGAGLAGPAMQAGAWGQPQAGAWPGATAAVGAAGPGISMSAQEVQQGMERLRQYLEASGRQGMARIVAAQDSTVSIGTDRMFQLSLSVDAPGATPYEVMHTAMVPPSHVGKMQAGATVPVRFDPSNPQVLLIDWESA